MATQNPTGFGGVSANANGPLSIEVHPALPTSPNSWHLWIKLGGAMSLHAAFGVEDREAIANLFYAAARDVLAVAPEAEAEVVA